MAEARGWWKKISNRMEPVVFLGAAAIVIAFCIYGGVFTESASTAFSGVQSWISETLGWYYVSATTFMLIFVVWLALSPFGKVRLGKKDERPEYRRLPWFVMLFSAGMGTGLVFWGVAEPLSHYLDPPVGDGSTAYSAREAMHYTFFHWGLHPWAIYMVFAVAVGYFHFRMDLPLAPRSILYPLLGERIRGPIGHGVDILCTVGTLLGVSTSLGLGAMQINVGLDIFFPVGISPFVQVLIIAVITLVATGSVVLGVRKGIRRLALLNLALAGLLLLFVLIAGPTVAILETFVNSIGLYFQKLVQTSFSINFARDTEWQATWTLFYWGWWISWSPFVGIFVARISRGRTVRELVAAGLVAPTLVTFFWMSVFGGTALQFQLFGGAEIAEQVKGNVAISLHALLQMMPWASVTMILATVVVIIFFITSSDSGSLVDDIVTSGGHPNPPTIQRVFWAVSEGAVAATLLVVGGLTAIQQAAISLGLPMSVLLLVAIASLIRVQRQEHEAGTIS
ncbi:BCCT family transporter [Gilvimarinus sp. F26214L]|uniref:BCCT family transporter n=1 Tax=Gilvimarinus sp. DZF01 TaxID=3461371 RepID=UPI004045F98B